MADPRRVPSSLRVSLDEDFSWTATVEVKVMELLDFGDLL